MTEKDMFKEDKEQAAADDPEQLNTDMKKAETNSS